LPKEDDKTDAGEGLTRGAGNNPDTIVEEDTVRFVAKFISAKRFFFLASFLARCSNATSLEILSIKSSQVPYVSKQHLILNNIE
jgi:hypothetical protein